MGCFGSSAVVPEEDPPEQEEDALTRLLRLITVERGRLRGVLPKLRDASQKWRYMRNTLDKLGNIMNLLQNQLEDEADFHQALLYHIADQDAHDIYEASAGFGTDEEKMSRVIVGRQRENIMLTDEIYVKRYNRTLEDQVRGENKSLLGLLTGSLTHLGRFLTYRCMPQAKRDALIIRKAMSGMGCSDYMLIEVLSTRTNDELKAAAAVYAEEFEGEDMVERIKQETGGFGKKWYGKWIDTLVEFERDETDEIPEDVTEKAQALYSAGAGKWMGCDEQPFIDILCKANPQTCAAIAEAYENLEDTENTLSEDVAKKMGGDLEFAVLARVRPKLDFLCVRVYKACKGMGTDEECICRVLGCLDNREVLELKEHWSTMYAEEESPFNDLQALIESEIGGSLLDAMNFLFEHPPPKDHWNPTQEYDGNAVNSADEFKAAVEAGWDDEKAIHRGSQDMHGPIGLVGVEDHFLQQGYGDIHMISMHPMYEEKDTDYLLQSTPSEVPEAETLLTKLKAMISESETEIENLGCAVEGAKALYYDRAWEMRKRDHHAKQFAEDNSAMLEFCAQRDADAVNEAIEGWGTDEDKLIRVLCGMSKRQLWRVDEIYQERYGKTLREVTDGELSGFFEGSFKYFMKCLLTKPAELDAELLRESMKGWGTSDDLLCEIVCTRSNKELVDAKNVFRETNGKDLEDWIEGDTSGFYQSFLIRCLKADRREGYCDKDVARKQAAQLHEAGLQGGDLDEPQLRMILALASEEQIQAICAAYQEQFGTDMKDAIKDNVGGDAARAMLARVSDKLTFYAAVLDGAFAGWGTDEKAASRILGRNPKSDVMHISRRYEEITGKRLKASIESETSGNYKKALLHYIFCEGLTEDKSALVKGDCSSNGEGETDTSNGAGVETDTSNSE